MKNTQLPTPNSKLRLKFNNFIFALSTVIPAGLRILKVYLFKLKLRFRTFFFKKFRNDEADIFGLGIYESAIYSYKLKKSAAFTLVELAIVLVIVGLLIGGVLQGQELIRQSKVQRVIKDFEKYKTAYNTFYLKYNCIAGDCPKATNFISPSASNGDGDKLINANTLENLKYWQHMDLSKIFPTAYDITASAGMQYSVANLVPGVNVPAGPFDDTGWNISGRINWDMGWNNASNINHLILGRINLNTNPDPWNPFLTSMEAFSIDEKIDDGKPGTGKVKQHSPVGSFPLNTALCITNNNPSTSTYIVTSEGINCHIVFLMN